jgi:hypothetical protein
VASASPIDDRRLDGLGLPRFDHDLPETIMSTPRSANPGGSPPPDAELVDPVALRATHSRHSVPARGGGRRLALVAAAATLVAGAGFALVHRATTDTPLQLANGAPPATYPDGTPLPPRLEQVLNVVGGGDGVYHEAHRILVSRCMSAAGFPIVIPAEPFEELAPSAYAKGSFSKPFGALTVDDVLVPEPDGPGEDPNVPAGQGTALYGTDDADGRAGGCEGEAQRQLLGGDEGRAQDDALQQLVVLDIKANSYGEVKASPAYASLAAEWLDCMHDAGADVAWPMEASTNADLGPVDPTLVDPSSAVAVAQDVACKDATNFFPRAYALVGAKQEAALAAHPGILEQYQAFYDRRLAASQAVLATASGK